MSMAEEASRPRLRSGWSGEHVPPASMRERVRSVAPVRGDDVQAARSYSWVCGPSQMDKKVRHPSRYLMEATVPSWWVRRRRSRGCCCAGWARGPRGSRFWRDVGSSRPTVQPCACLLRPSKEEQASPRWGADIEAFPPLAPGPSRQCCGGGVPCALRCGSRGDRDVPEAWLSWAMTPR